MATMRLNNELQRQLSYISDDEALMKKVINYIKRLGKERSKAYAQNPLDKHINGLLNTLHIDDTTQETVNRKCEAVRQEYSVTEDETENISSDEYTEKMLNKFYGAWEGDETATELMKVIKEGSTSRNPVCFD